MGKRPDEGAIRIEENVALANFTTLKLGGNARYFVECNKIGQILWTLEFARRHQLRVHVLGGGSNTVFTDEGFDGLVLKVALRGIQFIRDRNDVKMVVAAGESWEYFVKLCVNYSLAGVECLSGIPGLVGATPIQNVGAYGQEVAETITEVRTLERGTLNERVFANSECGFSYRRSRFNADDCDKFIITEVTFRLKLDGEPQIRYPELKKFVDANVDLQKLDAATKKLDAVRKSVIALRKEKSMVIEDADPNSRSVGSFFKNPIVTKKEFQAFEHKCRASGFVDSVPTFAAGMNVKIPAAWLVEHAGFQKGYQRNGIGVSTNHSLALINIDGTSRELLALAKDIQSTVFEKFGVRLEREPVVVQ